MEIIIYIFIAVIYAIASASGYNGRYSRNNFTIRNREYGRYGLLGVDDDFSLSLNNKLEKIRDEYSRKLQIYYAEHSPRTYLKNKYCELRLIRNENGIIFYCKEKPHGKKQGRYFEVQGNSEHSSTMWAIIDMEFENLNNYDSIKSLYYKLNQSSNSTGGLRYFYEPFLKKIPDYDEYSAQNEYCKVEYIKNDNCIICSELWNNNPRKFKIIGNKYLLLNIISEFKAVKDKFRSFSEIFAEFSLREDITIAILQEQNEEKNSEHLKQNIVLSKENFNENNIEDKESSTDFDAIKKYNERNLDL